MKRLAMISLCLGLAVLVLAGCQKTPQVDMAQVRQGVDQANAAFTEAFNQGDAAAVAALYTEDALVLPPNAEMVEGPDAIEAFWRGVMQTGVEDVSLKTLSLHAAGRVAVEVGTYSLSIAPAGLTDSGKYVVVWKQEEGGAWKLQTDIWNSSQPLPGAEMSEK